MIYNIDGNALNSAFNIDGSTASRLYNIDGESVFSGDAIASLKVMTFNVGGFSYSNSPPSFMRGIIDLYNPDIIGLQEVTTDRLNYGFGSGFTELYPHIYKCSINGIQENPILSKTALIDSRSAILVQDKIRSYVVAYYPLPNGKRVAIVNTHFMTRGEYGYGDEYETIANVVKNEEYFILLGDFNLESQSKSDYYYLNFVKPFLIDKGYNMVNWKASLVNTWFGGTTDESGDPCDNIIASTNISFSNVVFDDSKFKTGSTATVDHIPVVATANVY